MKQGPGWVGRPVLAGRVWRAVVGGLGLGGRDWLAGVCGPGVGQGCRTEDDVSGRGQWAEDDWKGLCARQQGLGTRGLEHLARNDRAEMMAVGKKPEMAGWGRQAGDDGLGMM